MPSPQEIIFLVSKFCALMSFILSQCFVGPRPVHQSRGGRLGERLVEDAPGKFTWRQNTFLNSPSQQLTLRVENESQNHAVVCDSQQIRTTDLQQIAVT